MFCKNEKCGIKVDREGDLCEMCQKCNVRHKCEEYKIKLIRYSTCYKCEELNKIVCVCGGKRTGFHRLCEYCIKYTKSCFSCSGRVSFHSDYIKHCNTCILNSHICSYIDCAEERYGNYCCKKHCCQNEGCLNIISQKKGNVKFCDMCICIGYECDNKKLQGSMYCDFDDCIMNKMKCKFENCKKSSVENFQGSVKNINVRFVQMTLYIKIPNFVKNTNVLVVTSRDIKVRENQKNIV